MENRWCQKCQDEWNMGACDDPKCCYYEAQPDVIEEGIAELGKIFFGGIPKEAMGSNQVEQQELEDWLRSFAHKVAQQARREERERIQSGIAESGVVIKSLKSEGDTLYIGVNDFEGRGPLMLLDETKLKALFHD